MPKNESTTADGAAGNGPVDNADANPPTPPVSPNPPTTNPSKPEPPRPDPPVAKPKRVRVLVEGTLGPLLLTKGDVTDDPAYVAILAVKRQTKVEEVK